MVLDPILEWSPTSEEMLTPRFEWEKIGTKRVGNPYVTFSNLHKEYRMYYSASSVHLQVKSLEYSDHELSLIKDSNIDEPIYLGLARADTLEGPWTRVSDQPLEMDPGDLGAEKLLGYGSIKWIKPGAAPVYNESSVYGLWALNNRVTIDIENREEYSVKYQTRFNAPFTFLITASIFTTKCKMEDKRRPQK